MKRINAFWIIFAIGIAISAVSGVTQFLPNTNHDLSEAIFFFVTPILVFMLFGRRFANGEDKPLALYQKYYLVLMAWYFIRSFYRLVFMLF